MSGGETASGVCNMAGGTDRLGKLDIDRILAARFGYQRYFEITTGTTGLVYGAARRAGFAECRRLVYGRDRHEKSDGLPIDFSSVDNETRDAMARVRAEGLAFDVILVDPHHTYDCSLRDIRDAFGLIGANGALVVHDCDPPDRDIAAPEFSFGPWCGVTYKAFIDFVLGNRQLDYFTVDADYGCGVILKRPPGSVMKRVRDAIDGLFTPSADRELARRWRACGDDYDAAFDLFEAERKRLLNLISPAEFRARYADE